MMTAAESMTRDALRSAETGHPNIQPSVLMHRNIDHTNVIAYTSRHVNEHWESELEKLIEVGWIVFRIQTEFQINGHETFAYFAKMKGL